MNTIESALIDSPPRHLLQHYEDAALVDRGGRTPGAHDLALAFAPIGGGKHASCDAVFDCPIILHIPNWREALAQVTRVLTPGGRFFFDEVTATTLALPTPGAVRPPHRRPVQRG